MHLLTGEGNRHNSEAATAARLLQQAHVSSRPSLFRLDCVLAPAEQFALLMHDLVHEKSLIRRDPHSYNCTGL